MRQSARIGLWILDGPAIGRRDLVDLVVGLLIFFAGVAGFAMRKHNHTFWSRTLPAIDIHPRVLPVTPVLALVLGAVFIAKAILSS